MVDKGRCRTNISCCLIGVKTPSILLPFLNRPSNILMMLDFHTFILFQLDYPPFPVSIILITYFRFGYNFSALV